MTDPQTEARAIVGRIAKRVSQAEQARQEMISADLNGWPNAILGLIEVAEEAATALAAKDAELEAMEKSQMRHAAACGVATARAERAEAQLAEERKALEPDAYEVRCTDGNYEWRRPYHGELEVIMRTGRDRSGKPFEYRALYAAVPPLTTQPAAPEGRQEAVAWRYRWRDGGDWKLSFHFDDGLDPAKYEQEPLFTRPSEQAVTEEMVEAAQDAWEEADNDTGDLDACWRAAIKAAMEAGR